MLLARSTALIRFVFLLGSPAIGAVFAPMMVTSLSEPLPALAVSHGPLSGEVTDHSAVLWARGSVPGKLEFTVSESDDFSSVTTRTETVSIDATTDLTGKVRIGGLKPSTRYHIAVRVEASGELSPAATGGFRTAPPPSAPAAVRFTFGSCFGGQEECRPPGAGWTAFERMGERRPDFFLLLGDAIYADGVCPSADGRNVPGAESVATDLDGFRARYRYHLEDPPYRAFLATTPVFPIWDNVVFVTGDTHHPFALLYDPDRDGAIDFHEFGASPIHAGVAETESPDQTFNPQVLFAQGGTRCFGLIEVAGDGALRGALIDGAGAELYSIRLERAPSGDE